MGSTDTQRKPIIAVAGLACETSMFTAARTLAPAFKPKRDTEIIEHYPFLRPGTPLAQAARFRGTLIGHSLPGGIVTRDAYEELSGEIVARLVDVMEGENGGVDGLWFDIHGAMVVEGMDDAEADLLLRIRDVIGAKPIVSASIDLHGNVSRELAHQTDLITCYRMAPHEDVLETKERAVRNLVDGIATGRRPVKAWLPLPVLLPGEQTSTRLEPAKHIYAAVPEVEAREGILDAAIWVGYAWADEPRNRAVIVVTGWDEGACRTGAEDLGRLFWKAHADFAFVGPTGTFGECLEAAVKADQADRPYFISDSGDNPTAGGSGDVTWGLTELLTRPEFKDPSGPTVIYASVPGPEAIDTAVKAGVGATVTVTAGAKVDHIFAGPLTLTGRVHSIKHGDPDANVEVVIQVGSVYAILTEFRKPYHKERDFIQLDLKPREADIVIVKIGYLEPQLYNMAKGWMLALSPGGVDQDLARLGHKRIRRPMWPFDKVFKEEPDLSAQIIPLSHQSLPQSNR